MEIHLKRLEWTEILLLSRREALNQQIIQFIYKNYSIC